MASREDLPISRDQLTQEARRAQASSQDLMARVIEVAEALARTEDSVAATMDWIASQRPDRRERLTALSEAARRQAAFARQWIADHSPMPDDE